MGNIVYNKSNIERMKDMLIELKQNSLKIDSYLQICTTCKFLREDGCYSCEQCLNKWESWYNKLIHGCVYFYKPTLQPIKIPKKNDMILTEFGPMPLQQAKERRLLRNDAKINFRKS